ncbi:hypothetical protein EVAR_87806_1 [Eumeta japonica]|uniref:Uncharacterized protein n=1 Tax=Eumeta variegata TaxID=151549 RepID=A0A4C1X3C3_EUMVA|nr:hypothetical protein EVAR_87806_1 [Eumeta japonica]
MLRNVSDRKHYNKAQIRHLIAYKTVLHLITIKILITGNTIIGLFTSVRVFDQRFLDPHDRGWARASRRPPLVTVCALTRPIQNTLLLSLCRTTSSKYEPTLFSMRRVRTVAQIAGGAVQHRRRSAAISLRLRAAYRWSSPDATTRRSIDLGPRIAPY